MIMKISYLDIKHSLFASLITSCILLTGCTEQKRVMKIDHVQDEYNNAVVLNERYLHGNYGAPDPASFKRLAQYKQDAYQAVTQLKGQFDQTKPIPKAAKTNAEQKINIYVSYLNALGATSATKNTFTGF